MLKRIRKALLAGAAVAASTALGALVKSGDWSAAGVSAAVGVGVGAGVAAGWAVWRVPNAPAAGGAR